MKPITIDDLDPSAIRVECWSREARSAPKGLSIGMATGVRATHVPTGICAECDEERSQHRNKARAIALLVENLNARNNLIVSKEENGK